MLSLKLLTLEISETLSARQHRMSVIFRRIVSREITFRRHIFVGIETERRIVIISLIVGAAKLEVQAVVVVVVLLGQALDGQQQEARGSVQEGDDHHEDPKVTELVRQ
jgi:hypothetical protein